MPSVGTSSNPLAQVQVLAFDIAGLCKDVAPNPANDLHGADLIELARLLGA